jgi:tRNA-dihydrouridine synthase C
VRAVREALPQQIPVSAKLRLGWDSITPIYVNAEQAAKAGANWITIHARTKAQGYQPPVYWEPIGEVRRSLDIPVVANGDIWTLDDFHRCREVTGCTHFMIGRGALARPFLSNAIASELGIQQGKCTEEWPVLFSSLAEYSKLFQDRIADRTILRLKQWMKLAKLFGDFPMFDELKVCSTTEELLEKMHRIPVPL